MSMIPRIINAEVCVITQTEAFDNLTNLIALFYTTTEVANGFPRPASLTNDLFLYKLL